MGFLHTIYKRGERRKMFRTDLIIEAENLEAGAKVHGIDPDQMVEDLNAAIK